MFNNNNNDWNLNADVLNNVGSIIIAVKGFFPHPVGGIIFIKSFLFIPYPAIPPYYVRTIHPGIRPTRKTYTKRNEKNMQEKKRHDTRITKM